MGGAQAPGDIHLYRLPEATFEPYEPVGGYWISRATVEPLDIRTVLDLVGPHENAAIELRVVPRLLELWQDVIESTLELSGICLANARP